MYYVVRTYLCTCITMYVFICVYMYIHVDVYMDTPYLCLNMTCLYEFMFKTEFMGDLSFTNCFARGHSVNCHLM